MAALCASLLEKVETLCDLSVIDLKKECERLGIIKTGKKDELMERIKIVIEENIERIKSADYSDIEVGVPEQNGGTHSILQLLYSVLAAKDKLITEKDKRNSNLEEIISLLKEKNEVLQSKLDSCEKSVAVSVRDNRTRDYTNKGRVGQASVRKMVDKIESPKPTGPRTFDYRMVARHEGEKNDEDSRDEQLTREDEVESDGEKKSKHTERTVTRDEKYRRVLARKKRNENIHENASAVESPAHKPKYENGQVKVLGDSLLRAAREHCKREGCEVTVFPGIRVHELLNQLMIKTESESEPEVVAIHVGTNNTKRRSKVHLIAEIDDLIDKVQEKWSKTKWVIGGLVYRDDVYATTIDKLNDGVKWLCEERGLVFYDPNSIISQREKAKDGLHLNYRGGQALGQLLMEKVDEAMGAIENTTN